jgi:hypothetical protein
MAMILLVVKLNFNDIQGNMDTTDKVCHNWIRN